MKYDGIFHVGNIDCYPAESSCSSYLCKDENRDRYHSSEDLSNLSSLSTAGDRVDSINKSNFIADNNHFYAFAINLKNMPVSKFNNLRPVGQSSFGIFI